MKAFFNKVYFSGIICVFVFYFGNTANALSIYNSEDFFLSIAPIESVETFDEFPSQTIFNTAKVVIDKVVYETAAINPESGEPVDPNDPENPLWTIGINVYPGYVSSPNDFGSNGLYPNTITFGPGKYVKAFGFWFIHTCEGIYSIPHWEITIKEINGQSTLVDVNCESSLVLPQFYGFFSKAGISKITINDYVGDPSSSNWSYDDVSRSKILKKCR